MPWSPEDITVALWLDAADEDTITESGGAVSQWDDKSGNDRHVSQATGSKQPITDSRDINGKNALDFDGSDDELNGTGQAAWINGTEYTIFAAVHCDNTTSQDYFCGTKQASGNKGLHVAWRNSTQFTLAHYGDDYSFSRTRDSLDHLFTVQYKDPGCEVWEDGASIGSSVTAPANDLNTDNAFAVGTGFSSNWWEGLIGEVIIITGPVSSDLREIVEGYLAHKWGITLPGGHTYVDKTPGNSWTPSRIAPVAWYDTYDEDTITESGGAVSQIDDKSIRGFDLTQATGSKQPTTNSRKLNGKNVFDFDGGDVMLNIAHSGMNTTSGWDFYTVGESDDNTGAKHLFLAKNGIISPANEMMDNQRAGAGFFITTSAGLQTGSGTRDTNPHVHQQVYEYNSTCRYRQDGTQEASAAQTGTLNFNNDFWGMASNGFKSPTFNGAIAEVVLFDTSLGTTDREKMEGYLAWKWGLQANLPGGHTYEDAPPLIDEERDHATGQGTRTGIARGVM